MRTTLELPDPLFREVKIRAAERGVSLKELLTSYVEKGLREQHVEARPIRSPLPTPIPSRGATSPSLTNAEIDELFLKEDLERWGLTKD
jgi:hypothetical protein